MTTDFQQVLDYIISREPGFMQTVKGVPRQELEDWQNSYSVKLPAIYLDLMTVMGHNSGRYRPLGWYDHYFDELASQVAWLYLDDSPYREDYPQQRYFQIGYVADEEVISPEELFLDLERCDGNDAQLVEMGSNGVYTPDGRHDKGQTLGELLMHCAMLQFKTVNQAEDKKKKKK